MMIMNSGIMRKCWLGKRVKYHTLGHKEKESFNTARLISIMSTWGYLEATRINGDKHGADLLFYRASDGDVKKIQLKGRASIDRKYEGKDLYIAYPVKKQGCWYIYPHDEVMNLSLKQSSWHKTKSWREGGGYSWRTPPKWLSKILKPWKVPEG